MAYKLKSKKQRKLRVETAIAHVSSTFNNTLVSITTPEGDVLLRSSAGKMGFKGARKGTPFAATQIGMTLAKDMVPLGVRTLEVNLQGPGSGKRFCGSSFSSCWSYYCNIARCNSITT
jgi:small subunit ribosomal protein S11